MTQATTVKRVFRYNGSDMPDPNPNASVHEVKDILATSGMAELQNASVHGPSYEEGKEIYTLKVSTGHKG